MTDRTDFESANTGDYLAATYYNIAFNATPPVGTIIPWTKSISGVPQTLPYGFVEANGQTLSDEESPWNGETLPDLNGDNRFLRGSSTSGSTGGQESVDFEHTHTIGTTRFNDVNANHAMTSVGPISGMTNPVENRPPFYNIVWLIKVR